MIIAKTRMSKIPQSCGKCPITYVLFWTGEKYCGVKRKLCPLEISEKGRVSYGKPSWCPLMEVENEKRID